MKAVKGFFKREKDTHKGDYGKVLILAGSSGMGGAACLSAEAALRSGAGLVYLGVPESLTDAVERKCAREIITLSFPQTKARSFSNKSFRKISEFAKTVDVLAIGPGVSKKCKRCHENCCNQDYPV